MESSTVFTAAFTVFMGFCTYTRLYLQDTFQGAECLDQMSIENVIEIAQLLLRRGCQCALPRAVHGSDSICPLCRGVWNVGEVEKVEQVDPARWHC